MNILLINSLYSPNMIGGAELSVQNLAESFVELGHVVTVVCLGKQGSMNRLNGVNIHYISLKNIHWPFGSVHNVISKLIYHGIDIQNPLMGRSIGKIMDKLKPDIVHTNNLAGFSVAIWSEIIKRNVSIIHTLRDMYLLCVRSSMFNKGHSCSTHCGTCRIFSSFKIDSSTAVKHVVGISQFILDAHLRRGYFVDATSSVIHNGYQALSKSKSNSSNLRLGFLGRLAPAKGIEMLIDTFRNVSKCLNVSLNIAGEGDDSYVELLQNKTKGYEVNFLGHVSPESFFSNIDVLIVPSLWNEPLGRVVIEANAHGIPTIVSNRGGLPEIVEDKVTGYIFEPDEPRSLQKLLEYLINHPEDIDQMRNKCLAISKNYLPSRISNSYMSIYNEVLAKNDTF